MRLRFALAAGMAALASFSAAQYVVRGQFNDWGNLGDLTMNETSQGSGVWTATAKGLNPGEGYEFKCTTTDWSFNGPVSNARTVADANGDITFFFMPNLTWGDGWQPANDKRVGWADQGLFGWELMGTPNGWSAPFATLTGQGNGLFTWEGVVAAGNHEFKFRRQGDWGYSIGSDFGNSASNATFVSDGSNPIRFSLDLPNGRWRTEVVPEPAILSVFAAGCAALARRRRRV